jgi:hypothetical protein
MESKTQFDLNKSLKLWRQALADSPSFQPDNLDELEVHIRDSVNTLETKGLSTEEAFLIAIRRVGQPSALDTEFGKVNSEVVWLSRWLWMAVGSFLFLCVQSLKGVVDYAVLEFGKYFTFNAHVLGFLGAAMTLTLFAALIIFLRGLAAPRPKPRSQFITKSLLNHPVLCTAGLVSFGISLAMFSIFGRVWVFRGATVQQYDHFRIVVVWSTWTALIAEFILLPVVVLYLYNRQLKARTNPV